MYVCVHKMRTRIITSPSFTGDKILGAILFENTMDREIDGIPTCQYLWEKKHVVPFLKIDKGLADEVNGVQLMKPNPGLDELLARAKAQGVYGTKMRSNINSANKEGITAIIEQQFAVGKQIIAAGLVPILEPEVNIKSPEKVEIEDMVRDLILENLKKLNSNELVMLKLSIPTTINQYKPLIDHPNVIRVVALSGGYKRVDANELLSKHTGMIASFSRALMEGINHTMTDTEFDTALGSSIDSILAASKAG
jgi:fructose-bisphosphate aldolase, class I